MRRASSLDVLLPDVLAPSEAKFCMKMRRNQNQLPGWDGPLAHNDLSTKLWLPWHKATGGLIDVPSYQGN